MSEYGSWDVAVVMLQQRLTYLVQVLTQVVDALAQVNFQTYSDATTPLPEGARTEGFRNLDKQIRDLQVTLERWAKQWEAQAEAED